MTTPEASAADLRAPHRRMQAAGLCTSSYYAATLSIGAFFAMFLFPGSILLSVAAALVAVVLAAVGLARLTLQGPSRVRGRPLTPHERVASKTEKRARRRGAFGLVVGGLVTLFYLASFQ